MRRRTLHANVFMYQPVFECAGAATKQAQFGIGIEAAVANPAAEEEILARDPEAAFRWILCQCVANVLGQYRLHLYHANYVSWKYAKAWERSRGSKR